MTTTIYTMIGKLPNELQDAIWSFNVEGHMEKTKKIIEEFKTDCTLYCAGCLEKVHIKDCFCGFSNGYPFSAEYFFYKKGFCDKNEYGIECGVRRQGGYRECTGMRIKRYNYINYYRKGYYRNWRYRLDIYDKRDEEDEDDEDDYY
jgi:hypothetical protein